MRKACKPLPQLGEGPRSTAVSTRVPRADKGTLPRARTPRCLLQKLLWKMACSRRATAFRRRVGCPNQNGDEDDLIRLYSASGEGARERPYRPLSSASSRRSLVAPENCLTAPAAGKAYATAAAAQHTEMCIQSWIFPRRDRHPLRINWHQYFRSYADSDNQRLTRRAT